MANNKKYISLNRLSNFLDNLKNTFAVLSHKHTTADITDYKVDTSLSSTSNNPVANSTLDAEFEAVSNAMSALELVIDGKADTSHNHNDRYYTETEIDTKLSGKADSTHNHDEDYDAIGSAAAVQANLDTVSDALDAHTGNSNIHVTTTNKSNWNTAYTHSQAAHARTDATKVADSTTNGNILINGTETNVYSHPNSGVTAGTYKSVTVNAQGHVTSGSNPTTLAGYGITDAESKGAANTALASAKEYTDTVASEKADADHNHDSAYDAKGSASSALASAKTYADSAATTAANKVKNDLLNGAGTAYDTLKELGDLIVDNQDAIDALETVASGKADKTHTHAIADVSGLQTALDGKASASHGTHVNFDSTNKPKMDGTAAFGTSTKVARADHIHPTDTSRAAKTDLDSHTGNTTVHITSTERSNWNAAKTHADSAHAPSNAEKNQNAFSNVAVGSTTIAADTTTDTLTLVAGTNVTITPDATNDKITISAKDTTYSLSSFGITATAAELNKLDGVTATTAELNYVDGVTSNIQTQLNTLSTEKLDNHALYLYDMNALKPAGLYYYNGSTINHNIDGFTNSGYVLYLYRDATSDYAQIVMNINASKQVCRYYVNGAWTNWQRPNEDYFAPISHAEDTNNPHGVTIAQIGAAPAGFGLGGDANSETAISDANLATKNGWYDIDTNTLNTPQVNGVMRVESYAVGNVVQTLFAPSWSSSYHALLQRVCHLGNWTEWEWIDPPMIIGVEYRTTERYYGKPVYRYYGSYTFSEAISGEYHLTIPTGIQNMNNCFKCEAKLGNYYLPFVYGNTPTEITSVENGNIYFSNHGASWGAHYVLYYTLYYTKTTD